ncbi:MAG: DUF418 domain-containing protein [Oxalobacteraceae bacterium]|nr:MAG: DUF418 domain-containing protein [Oxalobacteraceae bacterium]
MENIRCTEAELVIEPHVQCSVGRIKPHLRLHSRCLHSPATVHLKIVRNVPPARLFTAGGCDDVCDRPTACVFSHLWLSRFRYGPVEWLWRAVTYWQIPPMRIGNPAAVAAVVTPA